MSSSSLESMLSTLFLAPGQAAVEVEKGYRKIWAEWLGERKSELIGAAGLNQKLIELAPVMKVAGSIELALTMRVTSVSQVDGKISLGAGPISASGGYFKQSTDESAMSVRANFTLTNTEVDVTSYLARVGLTPVDAASLDKAITFLAKPAT